MNIDNLLKTIFWDIENNKLSNTYKRYIQIKHKYPNITQYITNRYNDSTSIQESVTRIVYNIEIRPTCPICGGHVDFIGKPNSKGIFKKHCSHSCSSKNKETTLKANRDYAKEQETKDLTFYTRKCLKNTAHSGKFSSDRTICEYVEDIWHI